MNLTDQLAAALRAVLPYAENVADDAFNIDTAPGKDDVSVARAALAAYDAQSEPEDFRAWLKSPSLSGRPVGAMLTENEQRIARMAWDAGRLAALRNHG